MECFPFSDLRIFSLYMCVYIYIYMYIYIYIYIYVCVCVCVCVCVYIYIYIYICVYIYIYICVCVHSRNLVPLLFFCKYCMIHYKFHCHKECLSILLAEVESTVFEIYSQISVPPLLINHGIFK